MYFNEMVILKKWIRPQSVQSLSDSFYEIFIGQVNRMDFKSMTLKEVNGLGKEFVADLLFSIEKSKRGMDMSSTLYVLQNSINILMNE
ncbi:hypothetical protein BKK45_08775 [Bacillus cereus]|nr:hypothetical protein BKK45_08775 [Bacillus cereus]